MDRRGVARLSARRRAGTRLWLSRVRPLRAGGGAPLQSQQAAARPVREAVGGRDQVDGRAARLSRRRAARGSVVRQTRQRARHAQGRGGRRAFRLVAGPQAQRPLGRHGHLRGARQGTDQAQPARPPARPRDLRRARPSGSDRAPAAARRHHAGAVADPGVHAGSVPDREGAAQLLGLQHARLLRARAELSVRLWPQ